MTKKELQERLDQANERIKYLLATAFSINKHHINDRTEQVEEYKRVIANERSVVREYSGRLDLANRVIAELRLQADTNKELLRLERVNTGRLVKEMLDARIMSKGVDQLAHILGIT